ncbi:MAG: hypothetical protein AAB649_02770 [Patescibacteria group bacterium]
MAKTETTIVPEKVKRERTHKLSSDSKQNVSNFATYRLNRYISAVKGLGACCGPQFDYSASRMTPGQIAELIRNMAELAAHNIETGNKASIVSGVQL